MRTEHDPQADASVGRPDAHELTIVVNGRKKTVKSKELTFDEIVALAYQDPDGGPNIVFTVTFRNGPGSASSGSVLPGGTVKIKDGMIFNVTRTDKS